MYRLYLFLAMRDVHVYVLQEVYWLSNNQNCLSDSEVAERAVGKETGEIGTSIVLTARTQPTTIRLSHTT